MWIFLIKSQSSWTVVFTSIPILTLTVQIHTLFSLCWPPSRKMEAEFRIALGKEVQSSRVMDSAFTSKVKWFSSRYIHQYSQLKFRCQIIHNYTAQVVGEDLYSCWMYFRNFKLWGNHDHFLCTQFTTNWWLLSTDYTCYWMCTPIFLKLVAKEFCLSSSTDIILKNYGYVPKWDTVISEACCMVRRHVRYHA